MNARSFTLLETVLASSLASVVVMGCFAAFGAVGRADAQMAARFEQTNDLARLQKTMQRTFTTLVVAPSGVSPLADDLDDPAAVEQAALEMAEALAAGDTVARPRLALGPDPDPAIASFLQRSRFRAGGGGTSVAAPQRLEVVLSSVPIRPPAVQSSVWADALVSLEDAAMESADAAEQEQYSGVRGAFVLRPDDPASRASQRRMMKGDDRVGWTLWWQPLDGRSEPARVASGLSVCSFSAFYDSAMQTEHECWEDSELPRYMQLEIETLNGLYASYLFEIVWTVDALTEEEEEEEEGQEGQGGGQAGDTVTVTGNGAGARGGDGQRGADGQRRGRPRPNAPQGVRPGTQQDARPMRSPPGQPGDGRPAGPGNRPTGPGGGGSRGGGGG